MRRNTAAHSEGTILHRAYFRVRIMTPLIAVLVLVALILTSCTGSIEPAMTPVGDENAKAPDISAKAAAIYSLDLDRIVYGKSEDERMDPYSITKILTCYLALENLSPDKEVTISPEAARGYENGTSIILQPGEKITVRDLIYGALLASGNDAAYALGEAVSGSEEKFAELMNDTVREWGCNDTHFVNANGWKDPDHYTTARDMCVIAKNCFANETLLEMSGEKEYTIPATNIIAARELTNYMRVTTKGIKGISGGKTGSWTQDDCSIVLQFSRRGLAAVLVFLGASQDERHDDAEALIAFSTKVTPGFKVSSAGDIAYNARVKHGARTSVELAVDGTTYAYPASNRAKDIRIETEINKLTAPLKKGDPAGKYRVYANDELIAEHGLVVSEDVKTGWLPSYIYISNKATLIILAVVAGLVLLILLLRFINKRRAARRRRERALKRAAMRDRDYQARH